MSNQDTFESLNDTGDESYLNTDRRRFLQAAGVGATGLTALSGLAAAQGSEDTTFSLDAITLEAGAGSGRHEYAWEDGTGGTVRGPPQQVCDVVGGQEVWLGVSPGSVEDEVNPPLELTPGETYTVEWTNRDGKEHDFVIVDGDGDEVVSSDTLDTEGESTSVEFEASAGMAQYYCGTHPGSQAGEIRLQDVEPPEPTDPSEAPRASVDRFSEDAGTLMVRSDENDLPGPDEPIDFDQGPFITYGLGPEGDEVTYYNFDVQPTAPAPLYVLFREGEDTPVEGQLNVIDVIPGDEGYNDFWHIHHVTVPEDYEANTVSSVDDIVNAGYDVEATDTIKNCPVVPEGSTAAKRGGDADTGLVEGWYDGQVVSYFLFEEAPLTVSDGMVPTSPIYVTFNVNPGEDGGGPASGFVTEEGSAQTHNVVATLPDDEAYSPLWSVNPYDNADFDEVEDLDSATDANVLDMGVANVNCPVVDVGPTDPADAPRASIDRFSEDAGTLMVRSDENDLPGPDESIDFDQGSFITHGLGPDGEEITYYNFDVQPTEPAPIYAFFREDDEPVEDQLNVIGVVPGDEGYNDFWQVHRVTVPDDYVANTVTSVGELMDAGHEIEATDVLKNCPVVPDGSTAELRGGDAGTGLVEGWYDDQVVSYFLFEESPLSLTNDAVPTSPIYVTFNVNFGEEGGGPASGFVAEEDSDQTHNVVATLPDDEAYSPLWSVNPYDNADFEDVSDLDSATDANILGMGVADVNCPVVDY